MATLPGGPHPTGGGAAADPMQVDQPRSAAAAAAVAPAGEKVSGETCGWFALGGGGGFQICGFACCCRLFVFVFVFRGALGGFGLRGWFGPRRRSVGVPLPWFARRLVLGGRRRAELGGGG